MPVHKRAGALTIRHTGKLPLAGLRLVRRLTWSQLSGLVFSKEALSLGDQAVASAANFLTNVIIGRACAKEEFGLYMLGVSLLLILLPMQTSLILGPYSVYCPRLQGRELCRYTGSTLIHQLALSSLLAVALSLAGGVLSFGVGPAGLSPIVWTLAATVTLMMLRDYAKQVSLAHLRIKTVLVLDIAVAILQVGALLALAHWGILSATRAYWAVGAAGGMAALAWLIGNRREFAFSLEQVVSDLRRNWAFGKWVFWGRLVYLGSNQLYPWLLVSFYGPAATGILAACTGTIYLANPFILGMSNYLGPKTAHAFASKGTAAVRQVVLRNTLLFLAVLAPFCLAMLVMGGGVLQLLYGAKYAGEGLLVGVLSVSQLTLALTIPTNAGLSAIERPDVGFKSSLVALGCMLTLGLWLVKYLGPLGVGFGLIAGNLAISIYRWVVFNRECPPAVKEEAS